MADLFADEAKHKPQFENTSTWQVPLVELIDGTEVPSTDPRYIAECEAIGVHGWEAEKRATFFESVERHRKTAGLESLKIMIAYVEPAYVLSLTSVEARRAYLAGVEKRVSRVARQRLEVAARALWEKRKAKACNPTAD